MRGPLDGRAIRSSLAIHLAQDSASDKHSLVCTELCSPPRSHRSPLTLSLLLRSIAQRARNIVGRSTQRLAIKSSALAATRPRHSLLPLHRAINMAAVAPASPAPTAAASSVASSSNGVASPSAAAAPAPFLPSFALVVAATQSGAIGNAGAFPWPAGSLSEDMARFKSITSTPPPAAAAAAAGSDSSDASSSSASSVKKNVVIMGRKTWESIPAKFRPLAGRINIVLSSQTEQLQKQLGDAKDTYARGSLLAALESLRSIPDANTADDSVFVIGGAALYREALSSPLCHTIHLTRVLAEFPADTHIPSIDMVRDWRLELHSDVQMSKVAAGAKPIPFQFQTLRRTKPGREAGNPEEEQYLELVRRVIATGAQKGDRTGTGTLSLFGAQMRFSLRDGRFPLLTSKRVFWRGVAEELIWLIKGATDSKLLADKKVHIWDDNGTRAFLDKMGFKDREVGDLGPCFPRGTFVLTQAGYAPIEKVATGTLVYTHTGAFRAVTEVMERDYRGKLVDLTLKYALSPLQCTPEHPFYARAYTVKNRAKVNGVEKRNVVTLQQPEFIAAEDLDADRHLVGFKIEQEETVPELTVRRYVPHNQAFIDVQMRLEDPAVFWMMGLFVGDGWLVQESNGIRIFFSVANTQIDEVVPELHKVFPVAHVQVYGKSDGQTKFRVHHAELAQVLAQFGKYAHGKLIPDWMHKAPKASIKAFIAGWERADGCLKKGRPTVHRLTTVSPDLAFSVQRLYLKLGHMGGLTVNRRVGKRSSIKADHESKLRDAFGFDVDIREDKRRSNYSVIEGGYAWFSIVSVKEHTVGRDDDKPVVLARLSLGAVEAFSEAARIVQDLPLEEVRAARSQDAPEYVGPLEPSAFRVAQKAPGGASRFAYEQLTVGASCGIVVNLKDPLTAGGVGLAADGTWSLTFTVLEQAIVESGVPLEAGLVITESNPVPWASSSSDLYTDVRGASQAAILASGAAVVVACGDAVQLHWRESELVVVEEEVTQHGNGVQSRKATVKADGRGIYIVEVEHPCYASVQEITRALETALELLTGRVRVYNFDVEGDHSYTVQNLAVHNCYGHQWRFFGAQYKDCHTDYKGQGVDQLAQVIHTIKTNPNDRRIIMSAWNPTDLNAMALPPCHVLCQFYVNPAGELSCQMYQRSCDLGLGVPFNIASYSLLTCMIAHVCGLKPGEFVHVLGDAHVYLNHVDALNQQLARTPRPFPTLRIKRAVSDIDQFTFDDLELTGYKPLEAIKMTMAV